MGHWTYTDIRKKVEAVCEELGVQVIPQSSTYRSQRCSGDGCGFVYKRNRKKKEYACSNCGLIIDADLNASINHEQDLPDIHTWLRKMNLNKTGFFWREDWFYTLNGEEITVPHPKEKLRNV